MKTTNYFNLYSINEDQRLFTLKSGSGFTCLGFDVCENRTKKLLIELKSDIKELPTKGTKDAFYFYEILCEYVLQLNRLNGFRSSSELNPKLIGLEGKRIEAIVYGERSWFTVGKSTGWIPCHLEIKTSRSRGGMGLPSNPEDIQIIKVIN